MKSRPSIFLSGVSDEFGTFRDAVETEVQIKGCYPHNQPSFAPDYQTVETMLKQKLIESDAVIHIVGFRFGAEPNLRPPEFPRRSSTQMEFDMARKLEKPVFIFISKDASVRQPPQSGEQAEDDEAVGLQFDHRDAVTQTNYLYYFFKDLDELCLLVARIPPLAAAFFRADISRIVKYAPAELIGREDETKLLNDAWLQARRADSPRPRVLTFVALGGEGKTSLVAKWAAELAHQDWPGCDAAFAWSFYSQGTREQVAASSDLFLKEALTFFGDEKDKEFAASPAGAFEKGLRLVRIVGQRRSLLILDGLEPLQYAPTSPTPGQLKDQGIAALLKGVAAASRGLCVVTTRYSLPNLRAFWQTTAPEVKLLRLSRAAGVHLLQSFGVKGSLLRNLPFHREQVNEFEKLVEDVQGHALTLNLLGTYLRDAHVGDIRKRHLVKLEEADTEEQGGHAFRVMEAYEREFEREVGKGQGALAVLRLLGLFDRPLTSECLGALLEAPAIPGLTEPLVDLTEAQRNLIFARLESARLLTVNRDSSGAVETLDAHPLLREYFARQLREKKDAWRAAHRRLYEHLCATTREGDQPTLEDLQPLYQAVSHGCQAGLQQAACINTYFARIQRGQSYFSLKSLGAFGSDLGAISCFFEQPWDRVSIELSNAQQAELMAEASACLTASGRLIEALGPRSVSLAMILKDGNWFEASKGAINLGRLRLMLGEIACAECDAEQLVIYSDRSGDALLRGVSRATLADALHQAGRWVDAEMLFREAEEAQKGNQSDYPLLRSLWGFRYCDLLLTEAERAAWQCLGVPAFLSPTSAVLSAQSPAGTCAVPTTLPEMSPAPPAGAGISTLLESCRAVSERAALTLKIAEHNNWIFDIALDHLTLGRAALYAEILESLDSAFHIPYSELDLAVPGLRRAGQVQEFPRALLTRAWLRFLTGALTGPESAQSDLDEAWEIAERGPMRLHLADIHLHRARLFFREAQYPWESPQADLAAAEKLINECGYHRRDEELADAKAAILSR